MELIEYRSEERLARETAAERLRALAESLSRNNEVRFEGDGVRYTLTVPSQVNYRVEIDVGDNGSALEIEIKW